MLDKTKKMLITNYVLLGVEPEKAYLVVGLNEEEIEEARKDAPLQKEIEIAIIKEEIDLLDVHRKAAILAAANGSASAIQWRIEKRFPEKYGNAKGNNNEEKPLNININLMPKEDLEKADNIEVNHGGGDSNK